jgi:hypothetical protein
MSGTVKGGRAGDGLSHSVFWALFPQTNRAKRGGLFIPCGLFSSPLLGVGVDFCL